MFSSLFFYIFFFFPFSLFVSMYVYASLCDFVCIAWLLPFALGFCLSVFCFFLNIVFSACYHWWICFFGLVALFFLSFFFLFLLLLNFFIFNIFFKFFILITLHLFYFLSFILFFSVFFWALRLTGSWCSSWVSGLCLWGGRAEFRTLVHQRLPSSM